MYQNSVLTVFKQLQHRSDKLREERNIFQSIVTFRMVHYSLGDTIVHRLPQTHTRTHILSVDLCFVSSRVRLQSINTGFGRLFNTDDH